MVDFKKGIIFIKASNIKEKIKIHLENKINFFKI